MENSKENVAMAAEQIIRNHTIMASGAGMIPIPIADVVAVAALQLDMLRQLCRFYHIDFREQQGKSIIASILGASMGKVVARGAVKLIPVVGTLLGGVASSVMSGASTYALGHVFKTHFENGGTILDFDFNRLKKVYDEKFEKGKEVAQTPAPEATSATAQPTQATATDADDTTMAKLERLANLRAAGTITEEEFAEMKRRVLGV